MDIQKKVVVDKTYSQTFKKISKHIAIVKERSNKPLIRDIDGNIYFGDNPTLLGLYIGKDSPVFEKILEVIEGFDENQIKFAINEDMDCIFTPDLVISEEDHQNNIKKLEENHYVNNFNIE